MERKNYVERYWIKEIIKYAKEQNLKYAVIWADKFYEKLVGENDLMSMNLIKQEISNYYKTLVTK